MRNVLIGIIILLVGIVAYFFFTRDAAPPERLTPSPMPAVRPPPPEPEPQTEQEPIVAEPEPPPPPLPELDASDELVRSLVRELSRRPELVAWLATEDLIRRFVTAVDNVAEGKSPREQLEPLWPEEKFEVISEDERVIVDPRSYSRYDLITEVMVSVDTPGAVTLYRKLEPLFAEAYADLGYPDRGFDGALSAAIAELLRAPVIVGEVELAPRVISYEYKDWELEGLSSAQKQLLRTGPTNAPRIQRKLRELAEAIGIPERDLPTAGLYKAKPDVEVKP